MAKYDVIIIHPPAVYDFRKKIIFPGLLGATVDQVQFTKVPIGMLSLAEYLDRHGYKVKIDNIGDRMVSDAALDVENHIKNISAGIFAIGLHFQWHSPGALEIARLCKKYHPHTPVILGGLTATRFHEEIIQKYDFIDAVVRGEAEKAFLQLLRVIEKEGRLAAVPNLTFRTDSGEVKITPLGEPSLNLDEFDYTRLDLLEPQTSIFSPGSLPRWSLEVCRGCTYNCSICGGSAYSYKTYLGMNRPAFRSPAKIIGDVRRLNEQGIRMLGLYQDPRMGGRRYTRELLTALRREKLDIERLSLDLLVPADEEIIQAIGELGRPVTVHICPDTGSEAIRRQLGRPYSNEDLLHTVKLCHKYLVQVTSFFSLGLAGDTRETINETWELFDKLSSLEQIELATTKYWGVGSEIPLGGPIVGPIALDPGSPAFDNPAKFGYRLLYKNLEEYIQGLSLPSWHQWINYETDLIRKDDLIGLLLESQAFCIEQREAYGFYDRNQAASERRKLIADIDAVNEVNRIQTLNSKADMESSLKSLRIKYDSSLGKNQPGQ
jgi:B12-binding domain/radical SAM domain protein